MGSVYWLYKKGPFDMQLITLEKAALILFIYEKNTMLS